MPTVDAQTSSPRTSGAGGAPSAVSRAVWNWQGREQSIEERKARRIAHLRKTGITQGLIGLGIAAVMYFWLGSHWPAFKTVGIVAGSIATFVLLSAIISPGGLFAGIEKFIGKLAFGVGVVLTWVTLAPIYFLFFLPFRVLARGGAKDKMNRVFPDAAKQSFWVDRSGDELTPESYLKMY